MNFIFEEQINVQSDLENINSHYCEELFTHSNNSNSLTIFSDEDVRSLQDHDGTWIFHENYSLLGLLEEKSRKKCSNSFNVHILFFNIFKKFFSDNSPRNNF